MSAQGPLGTFRRSSVPHLLGFHSRWAPWVVLAALVVEAALAWRPGTFGWPLAGYAASFAVLAVGVVLLVRPAADPFPPRLTVVVALAPAAAAAANVWEQAARGGEPGYYAWSWVYAVVLISGVALRGRHAAAIAGLAAACAVHLVGAALVGGAIAAIVATLVIATGAVVLLARQLRRQMLATHAMRSRRLEIAVARAEALAVMRERDRQVGHLRATVASACAPVLEGRVPTDFEKAHCLRAEARLRDRVRAGVLARPDVENLVERARSCGTLVHLLDDGGLADASAAEVGQLAAVVARELAGALSGQVPVNEVTVRVLPPRRPAVCTIVAERAGDGHRRVAVSRDGQGSLVEAVDDDTPPPRGGSG